jgi:hypothetical protein
MPVCLQNYVQSQIDPDELAKVTEIANSLLDYLNLPDVQQAIAIANQPGQSSSGVQKIFTDFAMTLGFRSEVKGLFANSFTPGLRPDYYLKLGEKAGILLEVERGKTTMNNMDLLDFWKCHICDSANYLFLLVPQALRQNSSFLVRNEFVSVDRRLSPFFQPGNYTNVSGLFLYGY